MLCFVDVVSAVFLLQCGLNDAVGPVFIEDGDMKGLSEGLRQQVDEGEWTVVCAPLFGCVSGPGFLVGVRCGGIGPPWVCACSLHSLSCFHAVLCIV